MANPLRQKCFEAIKSLYSLPMRQALTMAHMWLSQGPLPYSNCSKTVEATHCQQQIVTDEIQEEEKILRALQYEIARVSPLTGSVPGKMDREFQYPAGIEPISQDSL